MNTQSVSVPWSWSCHLQMSFLWTQFPVLKMTETIRTKGSHLGLPKALMVLTVTVFSISNSQFEIICLSSIRQHKPEKISPSSPRARVRSSARSHRLPQPWLADVVLIHERKNKFVVLH